jgi:hypothetical protein
MALEDTLYMLSTCGFSLLRYEERKKETIFASNQRLGLTSLQAGIFTSLIYFISLLFTKLSILCLYMRIIQYEYVRHAGRAIFFIVSLSYVWMILNIVTTCVPLNDFWDLKKPYSEKWCWKMEVFWSNAGLHMATDFLIFLLPLPVIFRLRLPRRQKIGLCLVFLLGFWYVYIHYVESSLPQNKES